MLRLVLAFQVLALHGFDAFCLVCKLLFIPILLFCFFAVDGRYCGEGL